jgi:hypothetical protein
VEKMKTREIKDKPVSPGHLVKKTGRRKLIMKANGQVKEVLKKGRIMYNPFLWISSFPVAIM